MKITDVENLDNKQVEWPNLTDILKNTAKDILGTSKKLKPKTESEVIKNLKEQNFKLKLQIESCKDKEKQKTLKTIKINQERGKKREQNRRNQKNRRHRIKQK